MCRLCPPSDAQPYKPHALCELNSVQLFCLPCFPTGKHFVWCQCLWQVMGLDKMNRDRVSCISQSIPALATHTLDVIYTAILTYSNILFVDSQHIIFRDIYSFGILGISSTDYPCQSGPYASWPYLILPINKPAMAFCCTCRIHSLATLFRAIHLIMLPLTMFTLRFSGNSVEDQFRRMNMSDFGKDWRFRCSHYLSKPGCHNHTVRFYIFLRKH